MRKLIIVPILFWLNLSFAADVSIGFGKEIRHEHQEIQQEYTIAYDAVRLMRWNDNYAVGIVPMLHIGNNSNIGLGVVQVHNLEPAMGTHPNWLIEGSICGKNICLVLEHISHGAYFGIEKYKANAGLNFLNIRYNL